MTNIIEQAKKLYSLEDCTFTPISGHEGGRNLIVIVSRDGEKLYVLRASALGDRTEKDYLAETEFVRYLAENGAPVADVIPSVNGKLVEVLDGNGTDLVAVEASGGIVVLLSSAWCTKRKALASNAKPCSGFLTTDFSN